jgi:hypothetical protein
MPKCESQTYKDLRKPTYPMGEAKRINMFLKSKRVYDAKEKKY